ncbi:hypothetical protein BB561_004832 [Smittium simulii]|uniref:CAF17 C-terminal domain-containing protein n=1 Tax=Smittium simulii TaxID=133385 RepID=A0A2T9YDY2_9FUNG|nr:hypothetical protein BB561_004832 [Smittium simulii]
MLGDKQKLVLRELSQRLLSSNNLLNGSYTRLATRGLVQVSGPDSENFLQGLTTNQMTKIKPGLSGLYQTFLYPNGRVMLDSYIYPKNETSESGKSGFIIEVDGRLVNTLLLLLRVHKLRAKIEIQDVTEEYSTFVVWGNPLNISQDGRVLYDIIKSNKTTSSSCIWAIDSRTPSLGLRLILDKSKEVALPESYQKVGQNDYDLYRMLMGIPEGSNDFTQRVSLPLELNLDIMKGVDFMKGCYVGQELTIRTHHRGMIRKRLMPVIFSKDSNLNMLEFKVDNKIELNLPAEPCAVDYLSNVSDNYKAPVSESEGTKVRRTRQPGRVSSSLYNVGLAVMRLDVAANYQNALLNKDDDSAKSLSPLYVKNNSQENIYLAPLFPYWWL